MKTIVAILLVCCCLGAGWNEQAKQLIFAPSFDFAPAEGNKTYRFTIESEGHPTLTFDAPSLARAWDQVPVGMMSVKVEADGKLLGTRSFYRAAPFNGPYGKPLLAYDQSA